MTAQNFQQTRFEPHEVEYKSADKALHITWSDNHQTVLPMRYLRGYCPCAQCQGHQVQWDFVENNGPALREILEVGNYALNLVFEDQHRTGIFSFEILRELCPCDACITQQGSKHPWVRQKAS